MARANHSIDPRILESARREFLAHGFENASLKDICAQAGVTTGALYKRYKNKEALFCAVVEKTVGDLTRVREEKAGLDAGALSDEALMRAWDMNEDYMWWWFDFLLARREDFVLLLKCAAGTRYANFQHDWVEQMTHASYGFYREAARRGLARPDISPAEMHILLSAFWTTIYEPFIHGFTREQMRAHYHLVCGLFNWQRVLGFPQV